MKSTAHAPANIAFVKYWGKSNDALTLPNNASISMNLAELHTITTVEFSTKYTEDLVEIGFFGEPIQTILGHKKQRVVDQLDRLRDMAQVQMFAHVRSLNNFPADVGIASSASAFAALTTATCAALNIQTSEKELSILTRLGGSGSATRSIPDGFTEWKKGRSNASSFAVSIAPPTHWDLADVVIVVSTQNKKASSLEGHESARTSPYYSARLRELPHRLVQVRQAIKDRNFSLLGREIEKDALSLHFVAMSSEPPLWYWEAATISVMQDVLALRAQHIEAYFTIDAGPNVHVLCEQKNVEKIQAFFSKRTYVRSIFASNVGTGAREIQKHLF